MTEITLQVSLFGCCNIRSKDKELRGRKQKALVALLLDDKGGRRTRMHIADVLWGDSTIDSERALGALRRTLSDMRSVLGTDFNEIFKTTHHEVAINIDRVKHITGPADGEFLEGLDIVESRFLQWLAQKRAQQQILTLPSAASAEASKLRMLPTIAIIPLKVVSGPKGTYALSDWLTSDIGRSLARSSLIKVISQLSSRQLGNQHIDMQFVQDRLNSDFILTGHLRADAEQIVVDLDFVDCDTGQLLWTRRFEGSAKDVYELNYRTTQKICQAIGESVIKQSLSVLAGVGLTQIPNHRLLLAGISLMHKNKLSAFSKARPLIEEAIRRSRGQSELRAWLAKWYILSVINGWSIEPQKDIHIVFNLTSRALQEDPNCSLALTMEGFALNNLSNDVGSARIRFDEAIENNPNEGLAWLLKGTLCAFSDNSSDAVEYVEHAKRLSPIDPLSYFYDSLRATAHLSDNNLEEALSLAETSLLFNNSHMSTIRVKLASQYELGLLPEARQTATELLTKQPNFTVSDYLRTHTASHYSIGTRMAKAMRDSGIPET